MGVDAAIMAIRQEMEAKIAAAPDDAAKMPLQLEMQQRINQAYEGDRADRQVADWKVEALKEFPRAIPQVIVGGTKEEILASAKAVQEHVDAQIAADSDARQQRLEEQARQRLYGPPPGGGGGDNGDGAPPTQDLPAFERSRDTVQRAMAAANMVPSTSRYRTGWASPNGEPARLDEQTRDAFVQGVGDLLVQRQVFGKLPDGREK